jgi:hypothetical protein
VHKLNLISWVAAIFKCKYVPELCIEFFLLCAGQQVEVIELSSPEVALVRVGEGGASGLVPTACLKLSPTKSLGQPGAPPRPLESEQGQSQELVIC